MPFYSDYGTMQSMSRDDAWRSLTLSDMVFYKGDDCFVVIPTADGPVVEVVFAVEDGELTLSDVTFHRFGRGVERSTGRRSGPRQVDVLGKPMTAALIRDLPLTSIIERALDRKSVV